MRRLIVPLGAPALLAGPTALAFFSGGYFTGPRLIAAACAWALVLALAVALRRPLPATGPGRMALLGLALITAWTAVSLAWAPLAGAASTNLTRLLLYFGAFIAALALLRERPVARAFEPTLAAGALLVSVYGLSERLLPSAITLTQSWRGSARLEQPITYWNAQAVLAAMGIVACARLAGDPSRSAGIRASAAAACAPLGLALWLSFSRGAIAACLLGLLVLVAAVGAWPQIRAAGTALAAAAVPAACSLPMAGVSSLQGTASARAREGAAMLAILLATMLAAAWAQRASIRGERSGRLSLAAAGWAGRLPAVAAAAAALAVCGFVTSGLAERSAERPSQVKGAARLTAVDSVRYEYWRVAVEALAEHPLRGLGSGGFRVAWLRERRVDDFALEVHSLPLEMAVELGLPGVVGFGLLLTGVGWGARRALRRRRELAAGSLAIGVVWLLHATIDWDWQLPAVTLPALLAAAALVAAGEPGPEEPGLDVSLDRAPRREPRPAAATASPPAG
jgi:hypothetical protein